MKDWKRLNLESLILRNLDYGGVMVADKESESFLTKILQVIADGICTYEIYTLDNSTEQVHTRIKLYIPLHAN